IILGIINIIASILGFIFGIILLAFGIAGLVIVNVIAGMFVNNLTYYNGAFSILIFIGLFFIILAVAAILGSCLSFCTGKKITRILAALCLFIAIVGLVILFIVELVAVILAFVYSGDLSGNLSEVLIEGLNDSYGQFPNETQVFLGVI
ncbi:hypothetical protein, partial [Salmonella sp. s54836]|uniref:hypothetical protein n=1 Tax=Salmonella sp. s54836 TaxID=3159673 RepID=UPI00397F1942